MANPVLYEDDYVIIDEIGLRIKNYYFPFGTAKRVRFDQIRSFNTNTELKLNLLSYKTWGMGLSNIWWALSCARGVNSGNIILEIGSGIRPGFSVQNVQQFLDILSKRVVKREI